jgi:hypothetical protein
MFLPALSDHYRYLYEVLKADRLALFHPFLQLDDLIALSNGILP